MSERRKKIAAMTVEEHIAYCRERYGINDPEFEEDLRRADAWVKAHPEEVEHIGLLEWARRTYNLPAPTTPYKHAMTLEQLLEQAGDDEGLKQLYRDIYEEDEE